MSPVRIYFAQVPHGCHGLVFPAFDLEYGEQFVILLNKNYPMDRVFASLMHELWHIWNRDFDVIDSVDRIEKRAHALEIRNHESHYPQDFLMFADEILSQEIKYVEDVA